MSVPFSARHEAMPPIGDPVIRIAAAVLALIDMQAFLPSPALGGDRDALDFVRAAIGKIDVDQHVARNAFGDDAADDVGRVAQARFPKTAAGRCATA